MICHSCASSLTCLFHSRFKYIRLLLLHDSQTLRAVIQNESLFVRLLEDDNNLQPDGVLGYVMH